MELIHGIIGLFIKGGMFMWPLLIAAIAAVVLVIERMIYLRENKLDWDRFHFELKSALKEDNIEKAIVLAARTKGLIGRVMQQCLLRVRDGATDVQSATEKEVLAEMDSMERSKGWLGAIIQIAPLLGLIGTVEGMIVCFQAIEKNPVADPKMLAGGIYTALIATFTGLLIAIPASVAYEHIRRQLNKVLHFLDLYLLEVREWVQAKEKAERDAEKLENRERELVA